MKLLIHLFFLVFSLSAFSQNTIDGSFEIWNGKSPIDWHVVDEIFPVNVVSDLVTPDNTIGNFVEGSNSCKIKTDTVNINGFKQKIRGVLNAGLITYSQSSGLKIHGKSFSGRPDSLVFYFKYEGINDTPMLNYSFTRWNGVATVKVGGLNLNQALILSTPSIFTRVSIPIQYVDANNPDSLYITFISSFGGGIAGSTLWVDDVRLVYNNVGLVERQPDNELVVYPNPATDNLFIRSSISFNELEIYSLKGEFIKCYNSGLNSIDIRFLSKGQYILKLLNDRKVVDSYMFLKE